MKKLIVLAVLLTACAPSATTVRLDTSLLEGLSVETETEDNKDYTAKITCWRAPGSVKLKACLRVASPKGEYESSRFFFTKHSSNTPRAGARSAQLRGSLSSLNVTEEGNSSNKVGKLQYLRLADATQQCVYLTQFSEGGRKYEVYGEWALGHTTIEAWYCDDTISHETMKAFFESITF